MVESLDKTEFRDDQYSFRVRDYITVTEVYGVFGHTSQLSPSLWMVATSVLTTLCLRQQFGRF